MFFSFLIQLTSIKNLLFINPTPLSTFLLFLTSRIELSLKKVYPYFYKFYIKNFEIFILKIYFKALIYLHFHLILFFYFLFFQSISLIYKKRKSFLYITSFIFNPSLFYSFLSIKFILSNF